MRARACACVCACGKTEIQTSGLTNGLTDMATSTKYGLVRTLSWSAASAASSMPSAWFR